MNLGDTVHVVRQIEDSRKESKEFAIWPRPTRGTVIYIGSRFLTVAMHSGTRRPLYRESFRPEEVLQDEYAVQR